MIGLGNDLSPVCCQAINLTDDGFSSNKPEWNKWNGKCRNLLIFNDEFTLKVVICKFAATSSMEQESSFCMTVQL